jgi:hypothetical protein
MDIIKILVMSNVQIDSSCITRYIDKAEQLLAIPGLLSKKT